MNSYERTVAASVIATPALASTIPPGTLRGDCLRIVQAVANLGEASADPNLLATELSRIGVERADALLIQLDGAATVPVLTRHLKLIREERARSLAKAPVLGVNDPYADPVDLAGEFELRSQDILDTAIDPDENKPWLQNLYYPTWGNRPETSECVLTLAGSRILNPGNIGLLSAHAGVGKSSVVEAICAAFLNVHIDALGFACTAKSLLLIDTERSDDQNHDGWTRLMRRCVIEEPDQPRDGFQWVSMSKVELLRDRVACLFSYLDSDTAPQLVILDGIGDLVADPNDSSECTALVYRISAVCKARQVAFFTTIHNNPSQQSDKMRGVLGSELWRKAQCSIMASRKSGSEIRTITTDYNLGKNRSDKDSITVGYQWCDDKSMFVSCDPPDKQPRMGKTARQRQEILEAMGTVAVSYTDLVGLVMRTSGVKDRRAKIQIKDMVASGLISKGLDGTYSSNSFPEG